jgi:hypothetical protein
MAQNTNLNASPYFDDFDVTKGYQRVLFKPGTPIQARELTTLQSILQNQVEKFGKHFFKEGSVVVPGSIAYDSEYTCVQIDPTHLGISVSLYIDKLVGKTIKGETSGVIAKVENYITDLQSDNENYTLYIKYQSSSDTNFTTNKFLDGENLLSLENIDYGLSIIRENTSFATSIVSGSTATGSAAKIEQGVYFIRGFFVDVFPQTIILDQYSNLPSYRVGLEILEEISVASQSNSDLYDNARGFSNFAAPGADRLKITTTLAKKSLDDFNDESFIELMRIENGVLKRFIKKEETNNLITQELARRTFDESGDYYVKPFNVIAKESLNNGIGNNGVYELNQLTKQGNTPSDNLLTLQVSPGKAYVRGYEVETLNTINLDLLKPRTTNSVINTTIPFSLGNQFEINNVYGGIKVGFGTTSQVNLYSKRTTTQGTASGIPIGIARVYDFKLKNDEYENDASLFETSLYDIQTYTYLNLNSTITLTAPAFVQGKNSSASGYLSNDVTNSNQLVLYGVSGTFLKDEQLRVNEQDISRTIVSVRDYSLYDARQLVSLDGGTSFTADLVLSQPLLLAPQGSNFTISTSVGGVSTITSSNLTFGVGINTGDIIAYTKSGEVLPTYNIVSSVNTTLKSIVVQATTSVSGVNNGSLPATSITSSDILKVVPELLNFKQSYFFTEFENTNISSVDVSDGEIVFKKSYDVVVSSNSLTATLETGLDVTLEPFDEEDYTLVYSNGDIEPLNASKFFITAARTINLVGLTQNGAATLTATLKKKKLKPRGKIYNRASVLTIARSSNVSSGIGSTTLGDGLTYSSIYGTRVQDTDISLGVPDVVSLLGIFESSDSNEPDLPKLQLTNFNANILNSVKGELIRGVTSNAIATLVANNGSNEIQFVYVNENTFSKDEKVIFTESNITANISSVIEGDRNIVNDFTLNTGQELEIANYSFITRRENVIAPGKKLKIVFNNYYIDPSDTGDFVTVSSYDKDRFSRDLPFIDVFRANDIIDLRPRVSPYDNSTNIYSPFEYKSRLFTSSTNSTPFNLAKDKNLLVSYEYYVGRIDKLYVNKSGQFFLSEGVPSLVPQTPPDVDTSLEIATIFLPAYVYNSEDVRVQLATHKRYRMQDITRLEDRLKNVEYYTALSLLETDTKNLTLKDSQTGLDRFKTGFFVDNFKSDTAGSLGDPMHKCSIDTSDGNLRPQHYTTSIDLLLGSEAVVGVANTSNPNADLRFVKDLGNPNIVKVGDVVCLKYTDVQWLQNKFATRIENVNPFNVVNWIGAIELNPATDTWIETKGTKKTIDQEGSYNSTIQQLGVDSNTGLSPITWGSWETTWVGKKETGRKNMGSIFIGSKQISQTTTQGSFQSGRGIPIRTTTKFQDQYTDFTNVTTLTTTKQSRQGIQYKVSEQYDTVNLGSKVVSTEVIHVMRSRNIEFIARRLKPKTQLYAFFDNVDVNKYVTPKLIEVQMESGTFIIGETIQGSSGTTSIRARLATPNHKYGPYNEATQVYSENPYTPSETIPNSYSSTSTILNIDTASLEIQASSGFYGYIIKGMQIKGETSGAVAKIKDVRLITDSAGTLIGTLYIPNSNLASTPSFETGTKTFTLTTSSTNVTISGATDSTAETRFTSSGTLNNVEETTLRIRNAKIERLVKTDERTLTSEKTETVASTSFKDRTTVQTRWVDPLAQSFEVPDETGIFITKVDVYFKTKDTKNLPITMQIRTMQTGLPTQEILPFGEIVLDPSQVVLSDDASKATTFTFPSPVYCETGKSYCVVLLSASDEYRVFISRMGEEDVSTVNKIESEKIIVSQQPLLGSLFKSQNGATWDPSQLEDLKLTIYRANFYKGSSTVRFYNPDLDVGNKQIVSLRANPLDCISRSIIVGLGKSLSSSEVSGLTNGVPILQNNNGNFRGNLKSVVGAIGIGSTLTLTSVGSAFTSSFRTYSNVNLISITGNGVGGKVNLSVQNGVAIAATVSIGGTGYVYGDALTVDYTQTDNLGKNLILSIPNNVGVISAFNSLLIDRVQGTPQQNSTDAIFYVGTSGTTSLANANVTYINTITDGLHFKVSHNNHGMYSSNDRVTLSGIEPDLKPVTLNSAYSSSSTSNITLSSVGIFTSFENIPVSSLNPGYVLIDSEIIKYTGVVTSTSSLTGITRKIDGSIAGTYAIGDSVYKYEINGVSLRRINKTHNLADTDQSTYPEDLDYYYVKVGMSTGGTDRTSGNSNNYSELYFKEDKSCGSYDIVPSTGSIKGPKATQNIPFVSMLPNFQIMLPEGTSISAKARTFSASTPDSDLIPFVDQGFEEITLNQTNEFDSPRLIASKINELIHLADYPGNKSFTIEVEMSTSDSKVSPVIDLDRINLITIANRINSKVSNYSTDSRVNSLNEDPTAAAYLSKIVRLEKSADNIKVLFDAFKHSTSDIRVLYRLFRSDSTAEPLWELFPGYSNLDANGQVINSSNNNGLPDKIVLSASSEDDFKSYEFTASSLPQFNGFQIKILMTGTNSAFVPKIRDLRAIASI